MHVHMTDPKEYTCQHLRQNNLNKLGAVMSCVVNGTKTSALLDTGAEVSLLSFDVYEKLAVKPKLTEKLKLEGIVKETNTYAWLISEVKISFDDQHVYEWNFYVASVGQPVVIGIDFLCHFHAILDFSNYTFTLSGVTQELSVLVSEGGGKFLASRIVLEKKLKIPPNSVVQTGALMKPKGTGEVVMFPVEITRV